MNILLYMCSYISYVYTYIEVPILTVYIYIGRFMDVVKLTSLLEEAKVAGESMSDYRYICAYIYTYIYLFMHIYVRVHMKMYVCIYIHM
jgi:hypothetical protein